MFRTQRYYIARAGDKEEAIGFAGLSCKGCGDELKRERGCHLPGFAYPAEQVWRIDYHNPLTWEDRALFCPLSIPTLYPEVDFTVREALRIEAGGGLGAQTKEPNADLNAWYVGAYELVQGSEARAKQEQSDAVSRLALQLRREAALTATLG